MYLKIGAVLFTIGLILISPLDDIFILVPLSAVIGVWIFPVMIVIAVIFLIIGGALIGKHLLPILAQPIVAICVLIAVLIGIYCIISSGWINI